MCCTNIYYCIYLEPILNINKICRVNYSDIKMFCLISNINGIQTMLLSLKIIISLVNIGKTKLKRIVDLIASFFDPCVTGYRPTLCEASKSPIRPLKFGFNITLCSPLFDIHVHNGPRYRCIYRSWL